ncbi:hypothetical protein K503DRAFT_52424 [Rhizopogon vinicolor AM-OR11-026]|uniref:Uncharacterized protein n=1 Tax=Rhizopogon vinicolor AM-OR11-026 TaxID=1314800 RepID=A0A1B7MGP6_9AGAM|nr:hypothetical protein K503DRAFT_52424 [Rhizopogon vinicolor AM-OR11-026]
MTRSAEFRSAVSTTSMRTKVNKWKSWDSRVCTNERLKSDPREPQVHHEVGGVSWLCSRGCSQGRPNQDQKASERRPMSEKCSIEFDSSHIKITASAAAYDVNFCFPVRELESDRIKLVPFIVSRIQYTAPRIMMTLTTC